MPLQHEFEALDRAAKIVAVEIDRDAFSKGNQFTNNRRLLVSFETDHRGKPLVVFNTFLGYEASMKPQAVAELAAMFAWAAGRADCPEFSGACIELSTPRT